MPTTSNAARMRGGAAVSLPGSGGHRFYTTRPRLAHPLTSDRRFRELVRRVHRLGPRACGELLAELVSERPGLAPIVMEKLERLASLEPAAVALFRRAGLARPAAAPSRAGRPLVSARALRGRKRALAKELRRLSAKSAAGFAALRNAAEAERSPTGRRLVTAELISILDAMHDPDLGLPTFEASLAAYGSTQGMGDGCMGECFVCCQGWGDGRAPGGVIRVMTTRQDAQFLAFACRACLAQPKVGDRIAAAVRRDFFAGEECRVFSASALAAIGGQA